jgi:hypothetical protein
MKKLLFTIGLFFCGISLFAQTTLTVGMTGAQVRTAINNNMLNPTLPPTTVSTTGVIYKGTLSWIHDYPGLHAGGGYRLAEFGSTRGKNLFIGKRSGNFTLSTSVGEGVQNVCVGDSTGAILTTGSLNTLIGNSAGAWVTSGNANTLVGRQAGFRIKTGTLNTILGESSMERSNASYNTSIGANAMMFSKLGDYNTMIGFNAGYGVADQNLVEARSVYTYCVGIGDNALGATRSGTQLIAIGSSAMGSARNAGTNSIAIGNYALNYNRVQYNIAIGEYSGYVDSTGQMNIWMGNHTGYTAQGATRTVAIGYNSAYNLTNGLENTFLGAYSGNGVTTGGENTLIGRSSGGSAIVGGIGNTFLGFSTGITTTGNYNLFLGNRAGSSQTGNYKLIIDPGYNGSSRGSEAREWRKSLMVGLAGADSSAQYVRVNGYLMATGTTSSTGTALVMDANGRVFMATSSKEFKHNIKTLGYNTDAILKVRPVTYNYIGTEASDIGYIAEEFQTLGLTNLLNYKDGKPFSIKYDRIPIYLIEVVKKQQAKLDDLEKRIKVFESR